MIGNVEHQLASQLPMAVIIDKLTVAGLERTTAARLPRWKAEELLDLIGNTEPGTAGF